VEVAMTADDVRQMYGETLERAPALPRYGSFDRECVKVLLLEIDRLKAGSFTEQELQGLRHKLYPDSVHDSVQRLFSSRKK
jgi:hypothetical protein